MDQDEGAAPHRVGEERQEPGRVRLLINADIGVRGRAQAMQASPGTDDGFRPVIYRGTPRKSRRPDDLRAGVLDAVVPVDFGGDVAHADRVHFRAFAVRAPGELEMVRRMTRPAEMEKTHCPRRAHLRRAALSPCRRPGADDNRSGADRRGESANNRKRSRPEPAVRCRPSRRRARISRTSRPCKGRVGPRISSA